jgi:hypothetical protein
MRLGIVTNLTSPTTDYYRSVNPFMRLRSQMVNLHIIYLNPETVKWYDFYDVDVILFQRPNGDGMLSMVAEANKMGKKIILDHDDLLHEVNAANPASSTDLSKKNLLSTILVFHFGKTGFYCPVFC